jgi:hypothetical protein
MSSDDHKLSAFAARLLGGGVAVRQRQPRSRSTVGSAGGTSGDGVKRPPPRRLRGALTVSGGAHLPAVAAAAERAHDAQAGVAAAAAGAVLLESWPGAGDGAPLPASPYEALRALRSPLVLPVPTAPPPVIDDGGERGPRQRQLPHAAGAGDAVGAIVPAVATDTHMSAWNSDIHEAPRPAPRRRARRLRRSDSSSAKLSAAGDASVAASVAAAAEVYGGAAAFVLPRLRPRSPRGVHHAQAQVSFDITAGAGLPPPRQGRSSSLSSGDDRELREPPERGVVLAAAARAARGRDVVRSLVATYGAGLPAAFMFARQPRTTQQGMLVHRALQRFVKKELAVGWDRWRSFVAAAIAAARRAAAATVQRAWRCTAARMELAKRRAAYTEAARRNRERAITVCCRRSMIILLVVGAVPRAPARCRVRFPQLRCALRAACATAEERRDEHPARVARGELTPALPRA